jgi:hypothetical protein
MSDPERYLIVRASASEKETAERRRNIKDGIDSTIVSLCSA